MTGFPERMVDAPAITGRASLARCRPTLTYSMTT